MPIQINEIVVPGGTGASSPDVAALQQRVAALENAMRQLLAIINVTGGVVTITAPSEVRIIAPKVQIGNGNGDIAIQVRTCQINAGGECNLSGDTVWLNSMNNMDLGSKKQIEIFGEEKVVLSSSARAEIDAPQVMVDSALVETPSMLRTQTMVASTVIASVYTPGVGNIW